MSLSRPGERHDSGSLRNQLFPRVSGAITRRPVVVPDIDGSRVSSILTD